MAELTRACHEAWIHHRTAPRLVEDCIERNPGKKGAAKLRAALGADATLSTLEDGFLALLRQHGLPAPRTNVVRHGDKVDCPWPQLDLTVGSVSLSVDPLHRGALDLYVPLVDWGVRFPVVRLPARISIDVRSPAAGASRRTARPAARSSPP